MESSVFIILFDRRLVNLDALGIDDSSNLEKEIWSALYFCTIWLSVNRGLLFA
jgi:hypothetical protein